MTAERQHWPELARRWAQTGPPLRPSPEDMQFLARVLERQQAQSSSADVHGLILGVTPEIYQLPWPGVEHVLAVDHTQAMIDEVWPGPASNVILGEWTSLPLESNSRDVVFCDGGLAVLAYPNDQIRLLNELRRVLRKDGRAAFRLYAPPERPESPAREAPAHEVPAREVPAREVPADVLTDLVDGNIASLSVLKLRLGMAMQSDTATGVRLHDMWTAIQSVAPDWEALARYLNQSLGHAAAIDSYRDCEQRYYFANAAEVISLFCRDPGGFVHEETCVASYHLAERCPTVIFSRL